MFCYRCCGSDCTVIGYQETDTKYIVKYECLICGHVNEKSKSKQYDFEMEQNCSVEGSYDKNISKQSVNLIFRDRSIPLSKRLKNLKQMKELEREETLNLDELIETAHLIETDKSLSEITQETDSSKRVADLLGLNEYNENSLYKFLRDHRQNITNTEPTYEYNQHGHTATETQYNHTPHQFRYLMEHLARRAETDRLNVEAQRQCRANYNFNRHAAATQRLLANRAYWNYLTNQPTADTTTQATNTDNNRSWFRRQWERLIKNG